MSEEKSTHPVYEELFEVAEKHGISDDLHFDRQRAISKVIVGEEKHWNEVDSTQAAEILTDIQSYGFGEVQRWALLGRRDPKDEKPEGKALEVYSDDEIVSEALSHVTDDETGKIIPVTKETIQDLKAAESWMIVGDLLKWIQFARIQDKRLYVARNCSSMEEYSDLYLDESYRQVKKKISVGRLFGDVFTEGNSSSLLSDGKIKGEIPADVMEMMQEFSQLGITKLYELSRLPDADFSEVISKDVVKLGDGKEFSVKDLRDWTVKEVQKKVNEHRKEDRKRIANLEEDKSKYKSERDHFKSELEKNQSRVDHLDEMEKKYGPAAARDKELVFNLEKAEKYMLEVEHYFSNIEAPPDVREVIKERILGVLRMTSRIQEMAPRRFEWIGPGMYEAPIFSQEKIKELGKPKVEGDDD